jgi:hypothetical protein
LALLKALLSIKIQKKTLKNKRDHILKVLPNIVDEILERKIKIDSFLEKYGRNFLNSPGEVKVLLMEADHFNESLQHLVDSKMKHYKKLASKSKKKKPIKIKPDYEKYLIWREEFLKKKMNGSFIYCDNPSSEYHIRRIPLDIGGRTSDTLPLNDENRYLATLDHIYPKKHFKDLEWDEKNIQILSRVENHRKGGDFVVDYRKMHIQKFLDDAKNKDDVLSQWDMALNMIHQIPIFRKTKGGVQIYKMDLVLDRADFIVRGMTSTNAEDWKKDNYNLLWNLHGDCLNKPNTKKKYDLNLQKTYLKRFEVEDKMNMILKTLK